MISTPRARLRSLSYSTSLTIENGRKVRLPVFIAAGSVADWVEKYAPYGQPRMHLLRYWQLTRPCSSLGWVMFAVREWIRWRVPPKAFLIRAATSFSTTFNGTG